MIRLATPGDAPGIRAVYAPYVEDTSITFELRVPTVDDVETRIEKKQPTYPWFVYEHDGEIVGYAYAGKLRERAAYQWVVETSVYVRESEHGTGVGPALYELLLETLEQQGFTDAYAVITTPNPRSIAFHESMRFEQAAAFPAMGYKHDEWWDVEWWRLPLAERDSPPTEPKSVAELAEEWLTGAIERAESGVSL